VVARLGQRIRVIVGMNGKTSYAAQRDAGGRWTLHSLPDPPPGQISNGDGVVLYQSSVLPGLAAHHYFAFRPKTRMETHSELCNQQAVIEGIKSLLDDTDPKGLLPHADFAPLIDWAPEQATPAVHEHLDYEERARLRARMPLSEWHGGELNRDNDALLYHATREAAARVLAGGDIRAEADRLGKDAEFLRKHLARAVMPILYG